MTRVGYVLALLGDAVSRRTFWVGFGVAWGLALFALAVALVSPR